jgi:hypothetical protein
MKIAHPLLLASALAGAALVASPAQAKELFAQGSNCSPDPGYEPYVGKDDTRIFDVIQFAYVNCFGRDPSRGTMNVRKVTLDLFDSETNDTIVCVVEGRRSGSATKTFGPLLAFSGGAQSGRIVTSVSVPRNNKTDVVYIDCYLPGPTGLGPSAIHGYTVSTR